MTVHKYFYDNLYISEIYCNNITPSFNSPIRLLTDKILKQKDTYIKSFIEYDMFKNFRN